MTLARIFCKNFDFKVLVFDGCGVSRSKLYLLQGQQIELYLLLFQIGSSGVVFVWAYFDEGE